MTPPTNSGSPPNDRFPLHPATGDLGDGQGQRPRRGRDRGAELSRQVPDPAGGGASGAGQLWLDWEGITDIDGQPVPFSETAREQLMGYGYIALGLAGA
ncbi:hypothetical protein [Roseovarius sp. MBR-6]|uniref:hypothetical protein n=1 Tax=Roseovarius sp. MBR-6 TaxID=3156459 RepID=UPI0033980583